LEDGVWAEVSSERPRGDPPLSGFGFAIFKCDWDEACQFTSPNPITLRDFHFYVDLQEGEGPPCVFPRPCGTGHYGEEPLDDPNPMTCLACFVNNEQHPYCGVWDPEPEPPIRSLPHIDDYRYFYFEVWVPGEFEDIEAGSPVLAGELEIAMVTDNDYLSTGLEDHHIVRSYAELADVEISRDDVDTWTVDVVVPAGMLFDERYRGCGRENRQGKCVGGWVYKKPLLAATTSELHFQATWTRSTQ